MLPVVGGGGFLDRFAALPAADCRAFARHRETGRPTGVEVQMACGDWVVVGTHG